MSDWDAVDPVWEAEEALKAAERDLERVLLDCQEAQAAVEWATVRLRKLKWRESQY